VANDLASKPARPFLSNEQVQDLNQRFGYFEFADAQGDVSRSFAQASIETYERVRSAAGELLDAAVLVEAHVSLPIPMAELVSMLREAAKVINSAPPGTFDKSEVFRFPLTDELEGAAHALNDTEPNRHAALVALSKAVTKATGRK
jgi:hypothetical protein